jgi:hypothetical protein
LCLTALPSIQDGCSHFEWRVGLSDTILKEDHPRTIPAKFVFIWLSGFRGEDLNVIFYQNMPNLSSLLKPLNQIKPTLAGMVLVWVPFKFVSDSPTLHSRWLLLLKIEISSIVHCCFSISQNELKFYLQLHGKE